METQTSVAPSETWLSRCSSGEHLRAALQVPREGHAVGDEQRGLVDDARVRHCGARSHRLRAVVGAVRLHGQLCENSLKTHLPGFPLRCFSWYTMRNKDDMGDGVPTDQLSHKRCGCADHCSSHIVASCVLVLLVSTLITRRPRRVPSTMSSSPSSSARASLVFTCQDTHIHKVTFPGQAAADTQERRVPATDRRLDSACIVLRHRGSTQSGSGLSLSMWCCALFCPMPCHKVHRQGDEVDGISRATPSSSWTTTMAAASEVCLVVGRKTHVTSWCVCCCYFCYNQGISSRWLLCGNGDVGEIVTSLNDARALMMPTLSCVPRFSNHDFFRLLCFHCVFFMWELADVETG